MKLLILLLCAVVVFIGLQLLEATPCSMHKKREMLRNACGNLRRKRGYSLSESDHPKRRHHKNHNHLPSHEEPYQVLANDTSGGILIRNKRGGISYCCLTSAKNCTEHFNC